MKYKLILMFVLSFIAHITIAGALVYVPYHLYNTARGDSTENIIWGQIQGAGSRGQRSEVRSQKSEGRSHESESRDRPSGLSGEQQGEQEMPPHPNPLPQGERGFSDETHMSNGLQMTMKIPLPFSTHPQEERRNEGAPIIPPPLTGGGEGEGGNVEDGKRISGEMAENIHAENMGTGSGIGNGSGDDEKGRVYSTQLKALIEQVKKEIERNKYYPLVAKLKGLEGTVYINFHIGQDGKPGSIDVSRSSGSNVLDAAAVKTIMNLKPFKNINPELRELDINVPITYKLREE